MADKAALRAAKLKALYEKSGENRDAFVKGQVTKLDAAASAEVVAAVAALAPTSPSNSARAQLPAQTPALPPSPTLLSSPAPVASDSFESPRLPALPRGGALTSAAAAVAHTGPPSSAAVDTPTAAPKASSVVAAEAAETADRESTSPAAPEEVPTVVADGMRGRTAGARAVLASTNAPSPSTAPALPPPSPVPAKKMDAAPMQMTPSVAALARNRKWQAAVSFFFALFPVIVSFVYVLLSRGCGSVLHDIQFMGVARDAADTLIPESLGADTEFGTGVGGGASSGRAVAARLPSSVCAVAPFVLEKTLLVPLVMVASAIENGSLIALRNAIRELRGGWSWISLATSVGKLCLGALHDIAVFLIVAVLVTFADEAAQQLWTV